MAKNDKNKKADKTHGSKGGAKGAAPKSDEAAASTEPAKEAPKPLPKSEPPAGSMLAKLMEAQRKKRDADRANKGDKVEDHSATRSRNFGPQTGSGMPTGPKGGGQGAMRRTAPGA